MDRVIVRVIKPFFYVLSILCFAIASTGGLEVSSYAADDMYTVRGVPVETTGKTGVDARNKAMYDIEEKAFHQLLQNLAPGSATGIASSVSRASISQMVQGIEIMEEKFSANRYKAVMAVSFSPSQVQALMAQRPQSTPTFAAPAAATAPASGTLLLPLYNADGKTVLLEGNNPWKDAWNRVSLTDRKLVLPVGDLEDITMVSAETAVHGDYAALAPIAQKYHAGEVLVVMAKLEKDPMNAVPIVNVTIRKLNPMGVSSDVAILRGVPGQGASQLLTNAATQVLAQMNGQPQQLAPQTPAIVAPVNVTVHYQSLGEWARVRQKLQNIGAVQKLQVEHIGPRYVDAVLYTNVTKEELFSQLEQTGLKPTASGDAIILQLAF